MQLESWHRDFTWIFITALVTVTFLNGKTYGEELKERESGRGFMSDIFSGKFNSARPSRSSKLISQRKSDPEDGPETRVVGDGKYSLRWRAGSTPPSALPLEGLPLIDGLPEFKPSYEPEFKPTYEPEFKPEKFVYICADPNDCPRGRRPVPYFRGQYRPREPLPPPPEFPNTPVLIGGDPTLLLTPELGPELGPGPELVPQNIETPLAAGEIQSPEFTPQIFEIQTEPQVPRPGQSIPEADILLDSRPQRIEDTTPNDDEVNSNSIVTRPRVPNPSSDEQRPIFNVPIQEPEDISQNEVTDNRPGNTGTGQVVRQRPRIRITTTSSTTSTATSTTTRSIITTRASPTTSTVSSIVVSNGDSSTTEIVIDEFFTDTKRARGTTQAPRSPTTLRTFPAVPGLSPEDINSMSKSDLMELVRSAPNPVVSDNLSSNVIEMVVEVFKRTGKELTDDDVEIIENATKQMGENLGKGLIRVVATMSEALGPEINEDELNAITKTANIFVVDDASLQTVDVVLAVASKVGPEASPEDLDMMVKIVASQQSGLAESGMSLKESRRMSGLLKDLGEDVTPEELQLIKDVTKELVPDLPDSKVELVSMILKELGPELEPQMIQTITAVAKEPDVSLTGHDVEVIAEMTRALGSELIQAQLEAVADLFAGAVVISENLMREVADKAIDLGLELEPHDVKIISDIVNMMGPEKSASDMEIAAIMTRLAGEGMETSSPEVTGNFPESTGRFPESTQNSPEVSDHASQILSNMVNALTEESKSSGNVHAVVEMAMAAIPSLSQQQAEIATTILVQMSPNVTPDIVQEAVEIVANVEPDVKPETVEMIVKKATDISLELTPDQIQAVVNLFAKMGPSVSAVELQRMAKQSNLDLTVEDVQTVKDIQMEMGGKPLTPVEVQVVALVTKSADSTPPSSSPASESEGLTLTESKEIAKMVRKMGPDVTPGETAALEDMIKTMDPSLTEDQAELFANFLATLAPKMVPKVVKELSQIVAEISTELTGNDLKKLTEMTSELSHDVTAEQVDIVADMSSKMSSQMSHRDMQMIARMAKNAGEQLTMTDVHLLAEVTKMLGPEVTKEETEIVALVSKLTSGDSSTLFREHTEHVPSGAFPTPTAPPPVFIPSTSTSASDFVSLDEAEILTQMLKDMSLGITQNEMQVIEGVVLQMDPSLSSEQAEVFTEILKEMGEAAKSPEVVQEIAAAAKQVEADLNIELIANLAAEVSREMTPEEIVLVSNMAKQMGPDLSTGEVQMITKMAPDLEMHDVEMIAEILKTVNSQTGSGEIAVISLLTKTASLRADDAITLTEATQLANMVNEMGPNLDIKDVAKIESLVKTMDRELTPVEAKIVSSMLQVLEGPALTPEVVQKAAEVAKDVEPDVTPKKVEQIAILVRGLTTEVSSQKVEVVAEMSKQMGPDLSPGEVQMISRMVSNSGLGSISAQDVKILSEITNIVGGPPALTPAKSELISLLTLTANEDETSAAPPGEKETSPEMSQKDAQKIMEVLHDMGPSISQDEKTEIKELMQSLEPSLSNTEAEVAILFIEHLMSNLDIKTVMVATEAAKSADIKPADVAMIARMAKELSKEVGVEVVELVAEVTGQMGPDITRNELHLMAQMAKNADGEIKEKDVEILSDIAKVIGPEPTPELVKVVAMLSEVSGSTEPNHTSMSKQECEKLSQMVSHMGANAGQTQQGVQQVEDVVFQAAPDLTSNQVKVMAQMLVELSGKTIAPATVEKVAELVKDASPELTPAKVKAIADMAESLSDEVAPADIELVSSMVLKMGPVLSHRETQMISRMAGRSGMELTMSDIHVLSDISNSLGNDLTTNDIEIISVLTKKAGNGNEDLTESTTTTRAPSMAEKDNKLSMIVRLKKPTTERPRPVDDSAESVPEPEDSSDQDFGMKENRNKDRKKFSNFSPKDETPTAESPPPPVQSGTGNRNTLRIRRPPSSPTATASTTAFPATTEEDILRNPDSRRRRPVPLRLAPTRTSSNSPQIPVENQPEIVFSFTTTTTTEPTATTSTKSTTTTTTSTTTTITTTTTSVRSSPSKPSRFSSNAATMLNNALGNPVGNSFMQFFMGNKELNNINFESEKSAPLRSTTAATTTTTSSAIPQTFAINPTSAENEEVVSFEPAKTGDVAPPTEPSNFMKFFTEGLGSDNPKVQQFEQLIKAAEESRPGSGLEPGDSDPSSGFAPEEPKPALGFTSSSTISPLFEILSTSENLLGNQDPFQALSNSPSTEKNPENNNFMKFFMGNKEIMNNSEFPDFATMINSDSDTQSIVPNAESGNPVIIPNSEPDTPVTFPIFETATEPTPGPALARPTALDQTQFRTGNQRPELNINPQSALMNFLLKTNLKEPQATLPTSFDPFVRETTTLDRTPSGNFLQILMGHQRLNGVDDKSHELLKKLEKKKIPLDQSGDNFMAFGIGDQLERRTIGVTDDADDIEDRYDDEDADSYESNQNHQMYQQENVDPEDPWPVTVRPTPFTVRPTLPVGQVSQPMKIRTWPTPTPESFTVKPTKKSSRHRTTTYSPPRLPVAHYDEERPELKNIPFTVRPTVRSNPYGETIVDHDVILKTQFEDPLYHFGGKLNNENEKHPSKPAHSSYNLEQDELDNVKAEEDFSLDYMEGGYKGLPNYNFPGVHDDRPDYNGDEKQKPKPLGKLQEHFHKFPGLKNLMTKNKVPIPDDDSADFHEYAGEASFGDLKFHLPNDGSFPDQPSSESMLRDLPNMGLHPNYPSTEDTLVDLKDLYLKNPFGNDFIRLEVDAERFRHNKTASGGIHHIPLIINGYPDIVKKTNRNDESKIERKGEANPKPNTQNRNREAKPKNDRPNNSRPKNVNRSGESHPKTSNTRNKAPESKPKNVNRNSESRPKSDKPKSKQPTRAPAEQAPKNVRRKQQKVPPPPAPVKQVSSRSSPPPTKASSTTTKTPQFTSQVKDRFPGFMQSLSNHASWVNRAWDLGAAAA